MKRVPDGIDEYLPPPEDEGEMNVKQGGFIQAIIVGVTVGVIVSVANLYVARSVNRDDSTTTAITELKKDVGYLAKEISKLAEQPYVRREEFESRITGLDARLGNVERTISTRAESANRNSR